MLAVIVADKGYNQALWHFLYQQAAVWCFPPPDGVVVQ